MIDVGTAFAVVFLAELGDKTQLVALTLAGRYRAGEVLAVLGATIAVLQLLSVTVGAVLGELLPGTAIGLGAGLLFLAFAVWTWRSAGDPGDDGPAEPARRGLAGVAAAFFLAELGDKTMLTTAGLAADRGPVPIWIGAFLALFAATALAVTVGRALTRRIGRAALARLGAAAFALVGTATIVGTLA
jgi:Ca2+/H+ antiporter, TMEM165/GDT1 family